MPDSIALALYIIALFFIGIGNAVTIYHILRYRDADDISGIVLVIYLALAMVIVVGTAILIDWRSIFGAFGIGA